MEQTKMSDLTDILEQMDNKIKSWCVKALHKANYDLAKQGRKDRIYMPIIDYSLKGWYAGQWRYRSMTNECRLRLNFDFILANPHELKETVIHEIAHHIVHHIWKGRGSSHGEHWKKVMARLGYPNPDRCYSYEAYENLKQRRNKR